jgi:hypothetical protein
MSPPPPRHASWDGDNWGVLPNDAGIAYYASLASLYASWGVDFVKVHAGAPLASQLA